MIRRQVMRHAPCVVMLVHDCANDLYLIEREYRIGCDAFAYGLPAGLIDGGEDVEEAALRELREETGVEPAGRDGVEFDHVGQFYSSEGMTDELANIMVLHLHAWHPVERHFDGDEHVESAWVSWQRLRGTRITASNSMIAILHEQIRRNRQNTGKSLSNRKIIAEQHEIAIWGLKREILESCKSDPDRCIHSAQAMTARREFCPLFPSGTKSRALPFR